jgi:mitogen-activated protein kinase kinase 3
MNRRRPGLRIGIAEAAQPPIQALAPPRNLDTRATITIEDKTFEVLADDLEKIADLGRGAYGVVEKMRHIKTGTVMAVKRITATVNTQEQVRERFAIDDSSSALIFD